MMLEIRQNLQRIAVPSDGLNRIATILFNCGYIVDM